MVNSNDLKLNQFYSEHAPSGVSNIPVVGLNMKPHAIWSLWDMFDIPVLALIKSMDQLSLVGESLKENAFSSILRLDLKEYVGAAKTLETTCDNFELPSSQGFAHDIFMLLHNLYTSQPVLENMVPIPKETGEELLYSIRAFKRSFMREAKSRTALGIPYGVLKFYDPKAPLFGEKVKQKFPTKIKFDLDEAGKCLALDRSTAAVFHLMRIVETSIEAIAKCLGISPPKTKSWGSWLGALRDDRIARNGAAGNSGWPESDYFQDVWQRIDSIKDAQRNATMHAEGIYTPEEAREIFDLTKGLMRKIASRMNEDGQPLA